MKKGITLALAVLFMLSCALATGCAGSSSGASSGGSGSSAPAAGSGADSQSTAPSGDVVELTFSYPQAENSFYGDTYGYFAKMVEEESGGTVKIKMFPAATLVSDNDILDSLMNGNVDMGHVYSANVSPIIQDLLPLEVPGAFPGEKYQELYDAAFEPVNTIYEKNGVTMVALSYPDTMGLASTGGIIKSPDDMKGMTIRSAGKWSGEAFKIWGAAPATIVMGDLSTALERGTVSGGISGWMMIQSFKIDEVAPYVTFTTMQNAYYGIVMNMDKLNSLTAEQQAAIETASQKFMEYSQETYDDLMDTYKAHLDESGAEYYELTDEENAVFADMTQPLLDEVYELVGDDGKALMDALSTIQ